VTQSCSAAPRIFWKELTCDRTKNVRFIFRLFIQSSFLVAVDFQQGSRNNDFTPLNNTVVDIVARIDFAGNNALATGRFALCVGTFYVLPAKQLQHLSIGIVFRSRVAHTVPARSTFVYVSLVSLWFGLGGSRRIVFASIMASITDYEFSPKGSFEKSRRIVCNVNKENLE
jgi:hypothetical protein